MGSPKYSSIPQNLPNVVGDLRKRVPHLSLALLKRQPLYTALPDSLTQRFEAHSTNGLLPGEVLTELALRYFLQEFDYENDRFDVHESGPLRVLKELEHPKLAHCADVVNCLIVDQVGGLSDVKLLI